MSSMQGSEWQLQLQLLQFHPILLAQQASNFIGAASFNLDWSQSLMSYFSSKTDILSKIAIFKLNLEKFLARTFGYHRG